LLASRHCSSVIFLVCFKFIILMIDSQVDPCGRKFLAFPTLINWNLFDIARFYSNIRSLSASWSMIGTKYAFEFRSSVRVCDVESHDGFLTAYACLDARCRLN
jgi:hypothetical protein